jgi:putative ABC transport system permease protein
MAALRYLLHNARLSLTLILTLALGLGGCAAVASLIYGFLLRPLPYANSSQLLRLETFPVRNPGNSIGLSHLDEDDFARRASLLAGVASYATDRVNLISQGAPQTLEISMISSGLFDLLGVKPQLGREFTAAENQPGGPIRKVILSDRLWRQRFGANPAVLGQTLRTAMNTYEIIGVMPPGFLFPIQSDLWITQESAYALRGSSRLKEKRSYRIGITAIARLQPGASLTDAQAQIATLSDEIARNFPAENAEVRHRLVDVRDAEIGPLRPYLTLLGFAVALVLFICCFNLASLLLAQASRRQSEFTLRRALGAQLRDIATQLLTESLILCSLGAALGLVIAYLILRSLPGLIPVALPFWLTWDLSPPVLGLTAALTLGCALFFALAPLRVAAAEDLQGVLRTGVRSAPASSPTRASLVVAEIALSIVLLVSAGWILLSFNRLLTTNTGFVQEGILTFNLSPYRPGENTQRIRTVTAYYEQVLNRLREIPGVLSVGGTDNFPFTGNRPVERNSLNVEAKGDSEEAKAVRAPATFIDVSPGYFATLGIPLLEGRDFTAQDDLTRGWVIILSQNAARTLFGNQSALGRQVRAGTPGNWDPYATVIGVVGNVKYNAAETTRALEFYYPYKQYGWGTATIAVRYVGNPRDVESQIRAAALALDPETPVNDLKHLQSLVRETLWQPRLWSVCLSIFAGLALLLVLIGLYGLIRFNTTIRQRELGIRAALGATPSALVWLVSRDGLRLIGLGAALAIPGCWAAAQLAQGLLFETPLFQPGLFLAVATLLTLAGLAASLAPAWSAARVDPIRALRLD